MGKADPQPSQAHLQGASMMLSQHNLRRRVPVGIGIFVVMLMAAGVVCLAAPGLRAMNSGVSPEMAMNDAIHAGDLVTLRHLVRREGPLKGQRLTRAIFAAAILGRTDALQYLLQHAEASDIPASCRAALPSAIDSPHRSLPTVNLLLAHGADPNARTSTGYTPLMMAARHDEVSIARRLLAAGAQIDAKDNQGITALSHAIADDSAKVRELLLHRGG
jgi:hypothetical protein